MNTSLIEQIAEAVLYEGYVLYPYRATSKKNQGERFSFGRVYPECYSRDQNGAEPYVMQTECLVRAVSNTARIAVQVRFLHPLARAIGVLEPPLERFPAEAEPRFRVVPELRIGNRLFQSWQEATERRISVPVLELRGEAALETPFRFAASRELEPIREGPLTVGIVSRRQEPLEGRVEVAARRLQRRVWKLTVRIANYTAVPNAKIWDPGAISLCTLASTHTVLSVEGGEFVSKMDPPTELQELSKQCRNIGTWPVLVGDEAKGERGAMLSSPIILYDYPKIAPESAGPLFDGTEIDEMLTLRILTLTDQEKLEMAGLDEQGRRLLERTEALAPDAVSQMHGRFTRAAAKVEFDDFFGASTPLKGVTVQGVYLRPGDRVRIRPKVRADIIDLALKDRVAIIEAVEQDLEKRVHLAVVPEDDPGKDLGLLRQPGHRFFYGLDEIEPLKQEAA
ncbi:MAG TPA: hypothetical protein VMU04_02300 [Candidatus Acidoferrum sp.]|nr:hypothetical protein [Candidatus Acidoferrum sp.]